MKTRKSISKRFKITKNGKILRRATGQDHRRAMKTGEAIRKRRGWVLVSKSETKNILKSLKS
ncbi:MAG: 50S ribosomal protein L35 [Parcubacteria group bacterium]